MVFSIIKNDNFLLVEIEMVLALTLEIYNSA